MENEAPFGVKGGYFLFDTYTNNCPITINNIVYPSVRQALVSLKTSDVALQVKISKTTLPADLKDIELSITSPPYWTRKYILKKHYELTLTKFLQNKGLKQRLLETPERTFKNAPPFKDNYYAIEEIKDDTSYQQRTLQKVQRVLLVLDRKKSP